MDISGMDDDPSTVDFSMPRFDRSSFEGRRQVGSKRSSVSDASAFEPQPRVLSSPGFRSNSNKSRTASDSTRRPSTVSARSRGSNGSISSTPTGTRRGSRDIGSSDMTGSMSDGRIYDLAERSIDMDRGGSGAGPSRGVSRIPRPVASHNFSSVGFPRSNSTPAGHVRPSPSIDTRPRGAFASPRSSPHTSPRSNTSPRLPSVVDRLRDSPNQPSSSSSSPSSRYSPHTRRSASSNYISPTRPNPPASLTTPTAPVSISVSTATPEAADPFAIRSSTQRGSSGKDPGEVLLNDSPLASPSTSESYLPESHQSSPYLSDAASGDHSEQVWQDRMRRNTSHNQLHRANSNKIVIPPRGSSSSTRARPQMSPRSASLNSNVMISPRGSSLEISPKSPKSPKSPLDSPREAHDLGSSSSGVFAPMPPVPTPLGRRVSSEVKLGAVFEGKQNWPDSLIPEEQPARSGPNPHRRMPGLSIGVPPLHSHIPHRPSPPVPTKSPLRGLSATGPPASASSRPMSTREPSGASIMTFPSDEAEFIRRISNPAGIEDTEWIDDRRLTTLTYTSAFYQDSGPSSGVTRSNTTSIVGSAEDGPLSPVIGTSNQETETGDTGPTRSVRRRSRMDDLWGKQRESNAGQSTRPSVDQTDSNLASSTDPSINNIHDERPPLPSTPSSSVRHIRGPSLPLPEKPAPSKAARLLGISDTIQDGSSPLPLLPSAMTRSPTAPNLTPRTPSSASKRTHLIREIASTERAYANDMILLRDAFVGRRSANNPYTDRPEGLRSVSSYSTGINGGDWSGGISGLPLTPLPRSPSGDIALGGYFSPPSLAAAASTTSFGSVQLSPMDMSRSPTAFGTMGPPTGKPLSPADLRAVFLNIDQIAQAAEELATAFEAAMGEEEDGPGSTPRNGEGGTDRLGEAFSQAIPRLRSVYLYYCARQSSASLRLVELFADSGHSLHLNDTWSQIKDKTHAWNLDSMLIKPIQRITKYPLLFEDLLACTTPVHPDYFAIRASAEMAKTVAIEIDEAKRRKDIVASALSSNKKPILAPSPSKDKGMSLKLFRKDKDKSAVSLSATSTAMSSSTSISLSKSKSMTTMTGDNAQPVDISKSSFLTLKDLIARVEEGDQVVKRIGKEVVKWTAAAKDVLVVEEQFVTTWSRVYQLESVDSLADRLWAFRETIQTVISIAWAPLNAEIRDSIMPVFAKLLDISANPRKVIAKRDSRAADYTRYSALRDARKPIDKAVLQSAREFAALHSQLVDELPAFLEGFSRILDLAIRSFAQVQAKYYENISVAVEGFARRWVARPRQSPNLSVSNEDLRTGNGIIQAFHHSWAPYAQAAEKFRITRPVRNAMNRLASYTDRSQLSPGGSRPSSPGSALKHSPSWNSSRSRESSGERDPRLRTTRQRSTSLLGQNAAAAASATASAAAAGPSQPGKDTKFSLLRHSKNKSTSSAMTTSSRPKSLHVPSLESMVNVNRYSFGLPRLNSETKPFEGLGLSPTKSLSGSYNSISRVAQAYRPTDSRSNSDVYGTDSGGGERMERPSSTYADSSRSASYRRNSQLELDRSDENARRRSAVGLGLGDVEQVPPPRMPKSLARQASMTDNTTSEIVTESPVDFAADPGTSSRVFPVPPAPSRTHSQPEVSGVGEGKGSARHRRKARAQDIDASDGWKNEPVLYQCACVAEFRPSDYGDKKYRGLSFLEMTYGDLFEIFHEVGRIDDLPRFPYPEVGVDNDGVLVGRSETGAIGLLICSFLEPLVDM